MRAASVYFRVSALLAIASCSSPASEDATTGSDDLTEGQCEIGGAGADRSKLDDSFFKLALNRAGGACPVSVQAVLDRLKEAAGAQANVFVVGEEMDKPTDATQYRFVLSQAIDQAAGDQVFLSTLASKSGVSQDFLEVMAFSPARGGFNFYHLVSGKWVLEGNGADATPGAAAKFECLKCHTTGGPLMKEQQDSWANWNSTWFAPPPPQSQDATFNDLFSRKSRADELETIIASAQRRHAKERASRGLGRNLKGLLQQVMCEVAEPNLVASHQATIDRHGAIQSNPGTVGSVFVHQMFGHDSRQRNYRDLMSLSLGDISIPLDGAGYRAALESAGVEVHTSAGTAKDAMFPMLTPDRGFADNLIIEELLERKVLDKELVADLLMTDFTVPSYSKVRCDLAATAPSAGSNPDAIRTAWIQNLAAASLPGAAELKARLEDDADFEQHSAAVKGFVTACRARASSDPKTFMADVMKIVIQRRTEFRQKHGALVESEALIPTATKLTVHANELRLDPKDCTAKPQ